MKLEFSRQIFETYSKIKIHENLSGGSRVVSCGRTDRQDEANSHFSQFYEGIWKLFIITSWTILHNSDVIKECVELLYSCGCWSIESCIYNHQMKCVFKFMTYRVYIHIYLTLYVPSIMFQCVDKPKRCNTSYEWSLLSINWLYMFRTVIRSITS